MGSIILCHKKKAKRPYEISRINRRIYTIEELCYYLCNHLYLIDYTIMNDKLCDWLEQELGLAELASNLRQSLLQHGSVEQFVVAILAHSSIYTTGELKRIEDVLEKLSNQKPIEKQKYKADNLLQSGAVKQAILIYQSIVSGEPDETVERKFYGKVYSNIFSKNSTDCYVVSDDVFKKISDTTSPQGIIALAKMPPKNTKIENNGRYIALENIQDPSNLGAISRTAEAFGVDGLILQDGCDPFSSKSVRASMGALLRIPIIETDDMFVDIELDVMKNRIQKKLAKAKLDNLLGGVLDVYEHEEVRRD